MRSSVVFGLLDERHDVAHAEDAANDAVGMERLEGVGLFADADELDGLAGDVANRERRATAGVAVHLGEDDAGEREALVELLAELTASWPVMASATKRISCGMSSFLSCSISSIRSSSMWRRPAVSTMSVSQPMIDALRGGLPWPGARQAPSPAGSPFVVALVELALMDLATTLSCSRAAGR